MVNIHCISKNGCSELICSRQDLFRDHGISRREKRQWARADVKSIATFDEAVTVKKFVASDSQVCDRDFWVILQCLNRIQF